MTCRLLSSIPYHPPLTCNARTTLLELVDGTTYTHRYLWHQDTLDAQKIEDTRRRWSFGRVCVFFALWRMSELCVCIQTRGWRYTRMCVMYFGVHALVRTCVHAGWFPSWMFTLCCAIALAVSLLIGSTPLLPPSSSWSLLPQSSKVPRGSKRLCYFNEAI
jgi:hypothetical protein